VIKVSARGENTFDMIKVSARGEVDVIKVSARGEFAKSREKPLSPISYF
jgi:hypothetical protein